MHFSSIRLLPTFKYLSYVYFSSLFLFIVFNFFFYYFVYQFLIYLVDIYFWLQVCSAKRPNSLATAIALANNRCFLLPFLKIIDEIFIVLVVVEYTTICFIFIPSLLYLKEFALYFSLLHQQTAFFCTDLNVRDQFSLIYRCDRVLIYCYYCFYFG